MLDFPRSVRLPVLLVLLVVGGARSLDAQDFAITDLGTLTGSGWSQANGLNNHGHVCGTSEWYAPAGMEAWHAFWWDGQVLHDVPPLLPALGWGHDLNDSDVVVGYSWAVGGLHAFRWENGVTHDIHLGDLDFSRANAINAGGDVVGAYAVQIAGHMLNDFQGFARRGDLWLNPGTLGGDDCGVWDVNERAQFVGGAENANGHRRAFLWDRGVMLDLGDLGAEQSTRASGLNNRGQVVGFSNPAPDVFHAFVWEGGSMTDLGTLGGPDSFANEVNGSGIIVGRSEMPSGDVHAFFHEDGVMTDLNDRIAPGSGWELTAATDINDLGQIVGTGTIHGEKHAWLLTPITDEPRMSTPVPGLADEVNTLHVINAEPDATLFFVAGTQPGQTPVPGCPGLFVDMADPVWFGTAVASGDGRCAHAAYLPPGFGGRLLRFQVVDVGHCEVSELVTYPVP